MKITQLIVLIILGMFITSCTKIENNYITVEYGEVVLRGTELVTTTVKPLGKLASTTSNTTDDYDHVFPTTYKAYFVSKETRGEYTTDQVVMVIDVEAGDNTITIPKLNYEIYITNYVKNGDPEDKKYAWYTWDNAINQLPQTSNNIYLYGKNNIDYRTATEGTVELGNPYAAVMIRNNQWIGVPTHNYGQQHPQYSLIDTDVWYLLYIKGDNTKTTIPTKIPGYHSNNYQLDVPILPNTEYRFTIDGSTDNLNNGKFFVKVNDIQKVAEQVIKL